MQWNLDLFMLLNASARPSAGMLWVAELAANAPLLLIPTLLTGLWIWGAPQRRPALLAVAASLFAGQGLNWLLGQAWYEPRPFMAGIGHTWIEHVADNGFPSDHATLAWGLGCGLMLTGISLRWGIFACAVAILTGWARVFLGVHFPVDVLVAAPVGLTAGFIARLLRPVAAHLAQPVERLYETILRQLPGWLPLPRRKSG